MSDRTASDAGADRPLWLIPLVVAAALFMENMDASVIGTALPVIARDLGEDPVILKLALTSYLLSLAVFIPISGWCADRFGARPLFQLAISIFIVSSLCCALAGSLVELILARALQGVGGAMMVPVGRLILLRSVPKSQMVQAMAYLTIPALFAPMIGPPIGGYVATFYDWRWIFWINVPFGLLAITLAGLYMPNVKGELTTRLDWTGFVLSGVGLSTLIFGFTIAGREALPAAVAPALIIAGICLLTGYVFHARRIAHPILDLDLLKVVTFNTSVVGGGMFRLGIGAIPFLLPLMLQVGFGLSALDSGLITFASAFGALIMKFTAPTILRRYGFRHVLTFNALICAGFLASYSIFTPETSHIVIVLVLLVGGFFRSLQFTSLNAVAYADISTEMMSRATALVAVAQQLFISAGVAVGAFAIEISRWWRGDTELAPADFSFAFIVIAVVSAVASLLHLQLRTDAGQAVSGHRS
ncbi:MAG: MDR family MFS transporter [Pseudomonadota bacterium]